MAKTTGPLISLDAHGSLAKTLNYSSRRSGPQCRKYNKPTGVPSAKQRGQRRLTEFLVAQWQNMSAADKATWAENAGASKYNLPAYHYFLREAQRDLYTHTGLCGYWHCNEIVGGKVLDLSGNGNHGSLGPSFPSNRPRLTSSENNRLGSALLYDGVDEFFHKTSPRNLDLTGDFSLEAIIYPTKSGTRQDIISKEKYVSGGENSGYNLRRTYDNKFAFVVYNDGLNQITSDAKATNKWYHLVGVLRGTTAYLYINNVAISTGGFDSPKANTNPFTVGKASLISFYRYGGKADEICAYNRALSAAEIATRYNFATTRV